MSRIDDDIKSEARTGAGDTEDHRFMEAAISFGRRALGTTAPNPSVGALVVRDGIVVGRGLTSSGGRPHAETEALRDAGELARGATMYVSLEPCSHFGLTPPCAQAIIDAGIARVVTGAGDPDPRVAGRGHAMMQAAGIVLVTGVSSDAARLANYGHVLRVTAGRPLVTLKLAETADGYAAGDVHDARLMITGQAANHRVQMMRASHDAIMIGAGTARIDDPLLTVRVPGLEDRNALRIVVDGNLSLPMTSRLVVTCGKIPLLVFCRDDAPGSAREALQNAGVEVVTVPVTEGALLDLNALLANLAGRGITRIFSEGGPRLGSELIRAGLADEVVLFTSPRPINRDGVLAIAPDARAMLGDGSNYLQVADSHAGADRMRIWRRQD